ncbi:sugar ABC transporter permease [Bombiscardovia nodaiensis]|uniref:Sugar ABC transporter permease n=1 Tax=Bombiscardovia nodaiensis TaxID=2932181 RepID=A0ABM8BA43_9BIFI|nr:sugar ABC transporter permease [Bombiscardovia nodaiensis]
MNSNNGTGAKARRYAILTVVSAILCAPLVFVVSIALSSDHTTNSMSFSFFPTEWHWENFVRVFNSGLPIGRFILNSLMIVIPACIFMTFSSALVSYGFARLNAPGKNILFVIVLSTMMIPGQVLMIPQFILFRTLGWVNTLLPIIVPNLFANAYNVFLMRQFITRIPTELDEAAEIDGLGYFGIFNRIILPMMIPVLAAVCVFTFSANWGSFFGPLLYINDEDKMPLALGLQVLSAQSSGAQTPPWNMIMVGSLILILPVLIVYYFAQKYLYESGMMAGSAGIK